LEGVTGDGDVVGVLEEVGVDAKGDVGAGVAESAGDEHDVEFLADQGGGVAVPKGVRGESARAVEVGGSDGEPEGGADVTVVQSGTGRGPGGSRRGGWTRSWA
jgi:hypothetical protein